LVPPENICRIGVRFGDAISLWRANPLNMKNSILLLSALVLAAVTPGFAQSASSEADTLVSLSANSNVSVARGMSREAINFQLGAPSETLGANVWVYWNFKAAGAANPAGSDTLVVVFSDGRVTTLRLCDSQPVRSLIAKQKLKSAPKTIAAK
jgi:hypothetical protein